MLRRWLVFLLSTSISVLGGLSALAADAFTISAPSSITYDPSIGGFSVGEITMTHAPDYVQVSLTLIDSSGTQVGPDDAFQIAVGNQCAPDYTYINPATAGQVDVSGDNTPTVIFAGLPSDVADLLTHVWVYKVNSSFCGGAGTALGQALLNRQLQVSGVPTSPGVWWSPSTHHYYQLVTQTTSDDMGQPTDDQGNITDGSRYFVRWSTARAEAKDMSLNIGGQNHRGYLAAITTKPEFAFLNNNVTGGRGKLYPAWVGGSDLGQEGIWKWVDGPEAKKFGGDSILRTITTTVADYADPLGTPVTWDENGYPQLNGQYLGGFVQLMRDGSGNYVRDAYGYFLVVDYSTQYCLNYEDVYATGEMVTQATPYGSTAVCDPSGFYLQDLYGNTYGQEQHGDGYTSGWFFKTDSNGVTVRDDDGNPAVLDFPEGFTQTSSSTTTRTEPNYDGARFWGEDSWYGPGAGRPDYCTARGTRGVCRVTQTNSDGIDETNDYYVYWSNGDQNQYANWDGTSPKHGDGVYAPQPDNARGLAGAPFYEGENALIINWCERNPGDFSQTNATPQTLYGNSGYYCTPGWNDLAAGDWGGASNTYPNPNYGADTPNNIGTTDFVVEFCGYSDEAGCDAPATATALTTFTQLDNSGCGNSNDNTLTVSYAAPGVMATELSSQTMVTETFDNVPQGHLADQLTAVGFMSGNSEIYGASIFGGAGGTGNAPTIRDSTITLPRTQCYLGFWWSAGNADNNVQLLDASDNVLASFTAADLVSALGSCNNNPYCGNPNNGGDAGELFAYVHMRLPTGFQKIRFYGYGFEIDNISTSVAIPNRSSGETTLSTIPVTTDCSSADADTASATLTACPRTISITAGSSLTYSPLDESQIPAYSYPVGVVVTASQVYTGQGQTSRVDDSHILISSNTPGQFFVDFTISNGSQQAAARITVNVTVPESAQVIVPVVLLVDPRTTNLVLPELPVSGGDAVSLCYRQVADSEATPIAGASALTFNALQSAGSSSSTIVGDYFVTRGTAAEVQTNSSFVRIDVSQASELHGLFIEVLAVSTTNPSAGDCAAGSHQVFEVRPLGINLQQEFFIDLFRG